MSRKDFQAASGKHAKCPESLQSTLHSAGLEVVTQNQMKNFLMLKNKIVRTDEIIQRYKERVCECETANRQLKETQAQLATMERGVRGLKAELQVLHEEKSQLTHSLKSLEKNVSSLSVGREADELLIQQLKAQVDTLLFEKREYERCTKTNNGLNDEKEKWKSMYQRLKREHNACSRKPGRPRKSGPLSPVLSPPYPPVFEETSSTTTSCSSPIVSVDGLDVGVEDVKNDLEVCPSETRLQTRSHDLNESHMILTNQSDQQNGVVDTGSTNPSKFAHVESEQLKVQSEAHQMTLRTKAALPLYVEPSLSDSDSSDLEDVHNPQTDIQKTVKTIEVINGFSASMEVNMPATQCSMPTVGGTSSSCLDSALMTSSEPTVDSETLPTLQVTSLSTQLFGESDSDDSLSISDDSSECSESRLDDLADLLNSEPIPVVDLNEPKGELISVENDLPTSKQPSLEDNGDDRKLKDVTVQEQTSNHVSPNLVQVLPESISSFLPSVHVESVAADSLNSEESDSELDTSFSVSYSQIQVLSPLPITPMNMDVDDQTLDTPLSPLPLSPSEQNPLSPLPQSPNNAHQNPITISPLPLSPNSAHLESHVLSPLPQSPTSDQRSEVITPLPASPETTNFLSSNLPLLNFADTAPCGLQVPKPCSVVVKVTSQSAAVGEDPPRRELRLSDSSPFSPPPFLSESILFRASSSVCNSPVKDKLPSQELCTINSIVDNLDDLDDSVEFESVPSPHKALRDFSPMQTDMVGELTSEESSVGHKNDSDLNEKAPVDQSSSTPSLFIGPVLPAGYVLPSSNSPESNSVNDGLLVVSPKHTSPRPLKQTSAKTKKNTRKRKISPYVGNNSFQDTSFDDLLQSFGKPHSKQAVGKTEPMYSTALPGGEVESRQRKPTSSSLSIIQEMTNGDTAKVKSDTYKNKSSLQPFTSTLPFSSDHLPPSKKAKLNTDTCCSSLLNATPVHTLPGNQEQATPTLEAPCYRLRSRQVDFFETCRRRRKSSSCSDKSTDGFDNEYPPIKTECHPEGMIELVKSVSSVSQLDISNLSDGEGIPDCSPGDKLSSSTTDTNIQQPSQPQSSTLSILNPISIPSSSALNEQAEVVSPSELQDNHANTDPAELSEGELESDSEGDLKICSQAETQKTVDCKDKVRRFPSLDVKDSGHPSTSQEPVVMTTRKRRHTDGATGQEEDQTPSNSPRQPFPSQSLQFSSAASDLSRVNCGYGQTKQTNKQAKPEEPQNDDIFSTPLPLVGGASSSCPPPAVTTPPDHTLSLTQQRLSRWMWCPLPLPPWLVTAMINVQAGKSNATCSASVGGKGGKKKRKKESIATDPLPRQNAQRPADYIHANLERLVLGQIHLSAIITMFSDLRNISSLNTLLTTVVKFLLHDYLPSINAVVTLYHTQCDSVRTSPNNCQPLDPSFPPALLKPETQLLALFAHLPRLNVKMKGFLSELSKLLYQNIVKPGLKFHQLGAAIRLFTGICRLQGDSERVLFLCFDLMRKPLLVNELPVIAGVASVWPLPLARRPGVKVQIGRVIDVKGLEGQVLSYTLEVVVMTMVREKAPELNTSLSPHMHTLCGWVQTSKGSMDKLTESLLEILKTSSAVFIDHSAPPPLPWQRPRPSVLAFHVVHCLRLISHSRGWVWINDTLIRAHLWPLLQKWNGSEGSEVKEAAAVCVVRLIGFVSSQGLAVDPLSSSISQLQRVLIALLTKTKTTQTNFSALQLSAVDSLLELCPPAHPRAAEVVGVVRAWLKGLCKPVVSCLTQEFSDRLLPYRTVS